jgi:squalene synthase HpnC
VSVEHYENFPVASLLCPPALRPAIRAIYGFARTADDLADEGDATAADRVAQLVLFRSELDHAALGATQFMHWPEVFKPLQHAIAAHALPISLLHDLLSAFEQDVSNPVYATRTELLDYCRRSANPIGRLLLHLYGITDASALARSDAICTALQLINFWQDLSVDLPRGRHYIPTEDTERHRLDRTALATTPPGPAQRNLLRDLVGWARELMWQGQPLIADIPGRMGWELRLVIQGGLRILEKIEAMDFTTYAQRPRLATQDGALMLWRSVRMATRPLPTFA